MADDLVQVDVQRVRKLAIAFVALDLRWAVRELAIDAAANGVGRRDDVRERYALRAVRAPDPVRVRQVDADRRRRRRVAGLDDDRDDFPGDARNGRLLVPAEI